MAATLRELRGRIRSAGSIKKITKAQELIATSRIAKAQARVQAARPYADRDHQHAHRAGECQRAGSPAARRSGRTRSAPAFWWCPRTAGCAAHTTPTCSAPSEELFALLRDEGKEPVVYVIGRKALGYYNFRQREVTESWTGFSERPTYDQGTRDRRHPGDGVHVRCRRRRRRRRRGRHPRRRRAAHRLHASSGRCCRRRPRHAGSRRWSSSTSRTSPRRRSAHAVLVRAGRRRRCSTHCCREYVATRVYAALLEAAAIGVGVTSSRHEVGHRTTPTT